ncbi:MAG TPA: response regulator transcription factor [Polyangia bacterium]|nr:response regulator transcription factor [Polyangia bacterium]
MIRRVLIVDDDQGLRTVLATALGDEGFSITQAGDGLAGLRGFESDGADLVILDILMPEMDGLEVCRRLRRKSAVPIVLLSSRGDEVDRVTGLETGADDYITKPFSTRELVARIRAIERRLAATTPAVAAGAAPAPVLAGALGGDVVEVGPLRLDPSRFEAKWRGKAIVLTRSEFQILGALARHRGTVLARERLLDIARGDDAVVTDRTVDTFIKRLRKKMRDIDAAFDEIETVFGVGYRYRD